MIICSIHTTHTFTLTKFMKYEIPFFFVRVILLLLWELWSFQNAFFLRYSFRSMTMTMCPTVYYIKYMLISMYLYRYINCTLLFQHLFLFFFRVRKRKVYIFSASWEEKRTNISAWTHVIWLQLYVVNGNTLSLLREPEIHWHIITITIYYTYTYTQLGTLRWSIFKRAHTPSTSISIV